jgi:hypothetical protein
MVPRGSWRATAIWAQTAAIFNRTVNLLANAGTRRPTDCPG